MMAEEANTLLSCPLPLPLSRPPVHVIFIRSTGTPMAPIGFIVNDKRETVNVAPDTPFSVLRDALGLTGTKFGCGRARSPSSAVA